MKKIIKGICDFRKYTQKQYLEKYSDFVNKQCPDILLLTCSDSRIVPNIITNSEPGDLFVVRNVGNLVPPYSKTSKDDSFAAAVEYAINKLNISNIIICGHSECGAMKALIQDNVSEMPNLSKWIKYGSLAYANLKKSALEISGLTQCDALSQINVLQQIEHLKTYPIVAEAIAQNKVTLHAWWFDLKIADIYCYNSDKNKFLLINT